jgi:aspartate aminotransferase
MTQEAPPRTGMVTAPAITPVAAAVPHSGIREISHLTLRQPSGSLVRLELGEPGARTASHIVEAAVAASKGRTGYTASAGISDLRTAAAARLHRAYGLADDPDRLVLGQGAVQLISCILAATAGPGDEVLVPDPGWPNYIMQTLLTGARPVPYPMRPENGFLPDLDELEKLISPRVKVLIVNSPSNPAGSVLDSELAEGIVGLAARRGVLVLSDEVYDEIVYSGRHVNLAQLDESTVISVFSFSKTYAMTGWRVGYGLFPDWLAGTIAKLQEAFISSLPNASQSAALAALRGPQDAVRENLAGYRVNRDAVLTKLSAAGLSTVEPHGAFYLMLPLSPGADSRAAAFDLVRHGVAMAPGSAFGAQANGFLRVSLASETGPLLEGVDRFLAWHARTDGGRAL